MPFQCDAPGQRREIAHHDLLRHRVQHGAAQLPAIARVAALAGRAGIDHQHPTDATDDLPVRMAVEHDIGVGLAKALQLGAGGQHIAAARLPRRRVHHQDALAVDPQLAPMGLLGEPTEQWPVDVRPGTRPHAGRAEEDLLVIAQDGERVEFAQPADHRVREAVLVDAVAETQQRIDRAHGLQGPIEAIDVAMQVGDDTELQQRPLSRLARSIFARAEASRPAWWALSLAIRSALLFSVRRGFAPVHCPQDDNEEQDCDWPMEPDPVQARESIDQNQKARKRDGPLQWGEAGSRTNPRRSASRGWLVSVAKPWSAALRRCNGFRPGR